MYRKSILIDPKNENGKKERKQPYHNDFPVKVWSIPNEASTNPSSIELPFLKTIEN
jgi:hypothetical protein